VASVKTSSAAIWPFVYPARDQLRNLPFTAGQQLTANWSRSLSANDQVDHDKCLIDRLLDGQRSPGRHRADKSSDAHLRTRLPDVAANQSRQTRCKPAQSKAHLVPQPSCGAVQARCWFRLAVPCGQSSDDRQLFVKARVCTHLAPYRVQPRYVQK
jgi:hypothetical protein